MATKINTEDRDLIIKVAKLFIDTPYQFWWEWSKPGEPTDCSRFTQTIYKLTWITLERNSAMQWQQFSTTWHLGNDLKKAEIWDLIFFKNTYQSENEITHVWIYMWNEKMIHAWDTKVTTTTIWTYWKNHFKWVWHLTKFTKEFNKDTLDSNYSSITKSTTSTISTTNKAQDNTLKAVNAVIAVLTSTRWDLPKKYQDLSAVYAKTLRDDYKDARKLEDNQAKKVYQSVVDFLSYARAFAWKEEQKKYEELNKFLREKHNLK